MITNPVILHIESSSKLCSVALSENDKLIGIKNNDDLKSHSTLITLFVNELLEKAKINFDKVDAISLSVGPGSYTGLRIGSSTAKGLCYALNKPLIAISTLKAMALGMREKIKGKRFYLCPMIDARRMEVYTAIYDQNMNCQLEPRAMIIDKDSFKEFLGQKLVFFGNGAWKCKILPARHKDISVVAGGDISSVADGNNNGHNIITDEFYLSARHMVHLALEKFNAASFEDIAYFESHYLK